MKLHTLTLLLLTLSTHAFAAEKISPFTSDGCSAFPDGNFQHNELWLSCCQAHDYAYWKGGTAEQRQQADHKLKECVAATGEPEIAALMLAGVRVGGTAYLPTKFRWGYGWPYFRGYKALSKEEHQQIEQLTPY